MLRPVLAAAALLVAVPHPGLAQEGGGQERTREARHRAQCGLAHQVLTKGQPAVKREWAVGKIGTCRELGGESIAAELDRLRFTGERTDRLERVVWVTNRFVDRAIARMALDIASDPTAGEVARVQAIRVLSFQVAPASNASYEEFVQPNGTMFSRATGSVLVGTPLTPEMCDRIRTELTRIHDDPSAPESVRIAARNVAEQAELPPLHSDCRGG